MIGEFERIARKSQREGWDSLTEAERNVLAIWWLEAEVNNGGFDQYYFNSASDHAKRAASALETIGAIATAAIVEEANRRFGEDGPPENRFARQERLEEMSRIGLFGLEEGLFDDPPHPGAARATSPSASGERRG